MANRNQSPDPDLIEKERQVVELRRAGATYEECARAVGYATPQGAYLAYHRALKRTLLDAGADEARQVEIDRLDRLQRAAWPKALQGEVPAINSVLKIMERRSRLLGLDAPTRISADVTTYEGGTDIDREVARLADLLANGQGGSSTLSMEPPRSTE
jgi:hypothetical protein